MSAPTCYMCQQPPTSVEHVPPKCLFPAAKDSLEGMDQRENLITVPSCEKHNSSKSKEDEYLLYVLALSFTSGELGSNVSKTKVLRAATRRPGLIMALFKESVPITMQNIETGEIRDVSAITVDGGRIDMALESCARALYFHEKKERFEGIAKVLTSFALIKNDRAFNDRAAAAFQFAEEKLSDTPALGANPDIFSYKIVQEGRSAIILMCFYEASRALVKLEHCKQ